MRLYTDTSMIYEGMANSFFLVEGMSDASFNAYIRENKKRLASTLQRNGVDVGNFNIVSPSLLDDGAIRELVLRQQPTLTAEDAERRVVEFKVAYKNARSRLLFVADVGYNADGGSEAKVFCEDDLGASEAEFAFKLNSFIDVIRAYYAEQRELQQLSPSSDRYKFPESYEQDALREHDNYECLCNDILAESVCSCEKVEISPILFDEEYNISLPLYPNVTITLEPLPKSLYILFLLHPEGIVLKDIQSYEAELKRIYSHVSGLRNPSVINRVLSTLLDPTDNPLHKNLSIIRRSFTSKLNYSIARNYIPAHGRTKAHNIPLESEYVILPDIA